MEQRESRFQSSDSITIYRIKRAGQIMDTITLQQAVIDLGYKGPGGNGEVEKRLRAGHTLENSWYIYSMKATLHKQGVLTEIGDTQSFIA